MKKFRFIHFFPALLAILCLAADPIVAQTMGKISGTILDAKTRERLVGANVLLVGTGRGTVADIEGSYFILNVTPGKYSIQASILGYQKVIQEDVIVNSNRTTA